jgi:hypothetical protein
MSLKPPSTPLPDGVVIKKMTPMLKHRPQHNLISNDICRGFSKVSFHPPRFFHKEKVNKGWAEQENEKQCN